MDEIGVFNPEQARLLWQDYLSRRQLQPHQQQNFPQRRPIDEVSPHRVFVRNDSGETIPRYACMQITGTVTDGGKTFVTVTKPTSTNGEYLFCAQFAIAVDGYGWAYRYGVVVMLGDGTAPTAAGVAYAPVVGEWFITEDSGLFIVWGESNAATDAVVGRIGGGGGGNQSIEFTVVSLDCSADPWTITAEVTWFSGGCTAAIPGEDSYGHVSIQNRCNIANYFTEESIVGLTGTATYRYPRTGACEPAWRLDDICGEGLCPT